MLTYEALASKAGMSINDAILLTPEAIASKAGITLMAVPTAPAAAAEAAAPAAAENDLDAAVAAQGALVRKLKEVDGLTNGDAAVKEAVAELKRLKALVPA